MGSWKSLLIQQIVRLRSPTNIIGIFFMVCGEMGRTPTMNWCTHILRSADDNGEKNQDQRSVSVIKAVYKIIIIPTRCLQNFAEGL